MNNTEWNSQVEHPLQSYEWGEFRKKTGIGVVRDSGIQVTIHSIPHTKWSIGYCPKGPLPNRKQLEILRRIAQQNNCIFIKVEPKEETSIEAEKKLKKLGLVRGRSLFTKFNFVLDVTAKEEDLLAAMKQKTRYNIRVAQKRGVAVSIDNSDEAFEKYLTLLKETTDRQGFFAHSTQYHRLMWETLHKAKIAHLVIAKYKDEIITTWVIFKFKDTVYYPYGASTRTHRDVMANNLVMWEVIKLAKKWQCGYVDMWGALGENPSQGDPWYGFHNFKAGYGARHVEYVGSYDFVANKVLYVLYTIAEVVRWKMLRILRGIKNPA